MRTFVITFMLCLVLASGCNFHEDKVSPQEVSEVEATYGYEEVREKVLVPKCFACHGNGMQQRGVNFDTYENTKPHVERIEKQVFELRRMPMGGSLTDEEAGILKSWLSAGAPEVGSN